MDRRTFVATLTGGLLAAPLTAEAQQAGKPARIGTIAIAAPTAEFSGAEPSNPAMASLLRGLRDLGYVYGRDFVTEPRSAEGRLERMSAICDELVRLKVDVIVAPGPALAALKDARVSVPVVMAGAGSDPVQSGLVRSLAHPGGNFTGMSLLIGQLSRKQLELLTEIVPRVSRVAVLREPGGVRQGQELQAAAQSLKRDVLSLEIKAASEIEHAFQAATQWRAGALLVIPGPLLDRHARQVVDQAAKDRLPAIYSFRSYYMEEGGLISYGVDLIDVWRRSATFVDKILKGAKPADLPVEQPTKFELVINLKTAKTLGLTIPPSLLARADQVIE